jgi:ribosomal protein L20A (L18A)
MKYYVEGKMKVGTITQKFVKEIDAISEKRAKEIILTKLGSDHKLKRTQIEITKVEVAK